MLAKPQDANSNESGTLTFIDNNVDMTTGTIKLKGTFRTRTASCGRASSST